MLRFSKKGIAAFFLVTVILTGCSNISDHDININQGENDINETDVMEQDAAQENLTADTELVSELKKKYEFAGAAEYSGNVIRVNRNEAIAFKIGYNPWDSDISIYDSFMIYQDADLAFPVETGSYDYDSDTGLLTIEPPFYGIAEMDSSEIDLSHLEGNYLSDAEEDGWGTWPQYYLVSYVDIETGVTLSEPIITVIKVNAELAQTPQLTFDQTEKGQARFTWSEVPGAEGYLLFMINKDEEGFWDSTKVFADISDTQWISEMYESDNEILFLNERFCQYYTSEDMENWLDDTDSFLKEYQIEESYDEYYREYFGVLAYGSDGCSAVSNLLSAKELAHMLPHEPADYSNEETFYDIQSVMGLPAVMCVTMCDGTTAQRVLEYDYDSIRRDEENGRLYITGTAKQTPFQNEFLVSGLSFDVLDEDLRSLKERQEELINKGGNVAPSLKIDDLEGKEEQQAVQEIEDERADIVETAQMKITANSALSEYIASNMLKANEEIDVSYFPEAADTEKLIDAFFEAQYQNPLILGVQGGHIDTDKRILYVEYDFDANTTALKQQEIMEKVAEITRQIISEDMTDMEKEMAINTYLCENACYDDGALENAARYSYTKVDEAFYDAFTAYGILIDGTGVCAGYSGAFKLLADAAGLESIVVTGYLEGSMPHAWNKVMLDGQWYIIDTTNNDNDLIQNALLNLSDTAAYGTLVESDKFVMNANLMDYMANDEELEYYHVTNRYYEQNEIADKLVQLLTEEGNAVLRTDYTIGDEEYKLIAKKVSHTGRKRVNGFYWMGVICMEE